MPVLAPGGVYSMLSVISEIATAIVSGGLSNIVGPTFCETSPFDICVLDVLNDLSDITAAAV